jgi:pimeloyl-ACP methyl ester carboxylesterase
MLSEGPVDTALVFVHGFAGNAVTTWVDFHAQINGTTFASDFAHCDLFFYEYDSTGNTVEQSTLHLGRFVDDIVANVTPRTFRMWLSDAGDAIKGTNPRVLDALSRGYERIIFVAHSLGGVVVRRLVLNAAEGSQHWTRAHSRITGSRLILFAPAHFGFRHDLLANLVISSSPVLQIAAAAFLLTRGKVYPDVVQSSETLRGLRTDSESLFSRQKTPAALQAYVYWGVDEQVVIPGKYEQDSQRKEPNVDHVRVCKPTADFDLPAKWVRDGL